MANAVKQVTTEELAEILGVTPRRINQIAREGRIFQRESSGNFDVVFCIEQYFKDKFIPMDGRVSYDTEKALHERAKREKAELELSLMKNETYRAEDIELALVPMLLAVRNRILAIAPMVSEKLAGKSVQEIEAILTKEHREALTELSEYGKIQFGSNEYVITRTEEGN